MVRFTIDSVVRELLIEQGEANENKYARYLQHGISVLRELNMDVAGNGDGVPTPVELLVNDNQTVDLPPDYINYVRIGILDGHGNFVGLGYNGNIRMADPVDKCGNPINPAKNIQQQTNVEQASFDLRSGFIASWDGYADNFRNGEVTGRFFGIGGGTNPYGYYRINAKTGQIELSAVKAKTIFLEYLSDLQYVDGEFIVHPFVVETVKRGIIWRTLSYNEKKSGGLKQEARNEYFNEYRRSKARFNSKNVSEWWDAFRFSNKLSPKF